MDRFLPGRHPIDSFGSGGFRLGGVSHVGSILVTPAGVWAFARTSAAALTGTDLAPFVSLRDQIDILLVGTGKDLAPLPGPIMVLLREAELPVEVMSTHAAIRTYNVVLEENRRVAAVFLAVD